MKDYRWLIANSLYTAVFGVLVWAVYRDYLAFGLFLGAVSQFYFAMSIRQEYIVSKHPFII